jgi:WYL domain
MTITETIGNAIRNRTELKIGYVDSSASTFLLEPYVLFSDPDGRLTLYGYIWASDPVPYIKGSRTFLVDRIASIEITENSFRRPQQDYFDRDWTQVRIVCDVYYPAGITSTKTWQDRHASS